MDLKQLQREAQKAISHTEWSKADLILRKWCELRPRDARGWYYRAYAQMKTGNIKEARRFAEKALALKADYQEAARLLTAIMAQDNAGERRSAPDTDEDWAIGRLVAGRYEIRDRKEGGMGRVYFAFDRELDHMVAIKTPLPFMLKSPARKARVLREAEAWIGLGIHPNICSAYYVQEIGGIPRLLIEFIDGGTLGDLLKREEELDYWDCLDLALQIASGMNHTHTFPWQDEDGHAHQGLVHRDLKPDNILLDKNSLAKITDFGLVNLGKGDDALDGPEGTAPEGDESSDSRPDHLWQTVTVAGAAIGTPAYMAPEQWKASGIGRAADIYAYGCILYEIFCSRRPFTLDPKYQNAMPSLRISFWEQMHLEQPPPSPLEFNQNLDEKLAGLMIRCLRKKPEERPAGFDEIAAELKSIYTAAAGRPYPRPEPKPSRLVADSLNNQGASYYTLGQVKRAGETWKRSLEIDPQHLEATLNMALYEWDRLGGDYLEILRRLDEIGRTHTSSWRYFHLLGKVFLFFGDFEKAAANLHRADETGAGGTRVLKDYFLALCASANRHGDPGGWGRVKECGQRLLEAGYDDAQVLTGQALALKRRGEKDESKRFYEQARGRHPDLPSRIEESKHRFLPGHEIISSINHQGWVNSLAFSPDGTRAVCGSQDSVSVWRIGLSQEEAFSDGKGGLGRGKASNRPLLLVEPWDIKTADKLERLGLQTGHVWCTSLGPDGNQLLVGGTDGALDLYDIQTGRRSLSLKGHSEDVLTVAADCFKRYGLSGGRDPAVRLWDLKTGKCLQTFEGHDGQVTSVAFGPDGRYVLSAGDDKKVRLWEIKTGQCLKVLAGHTDRVVAVAFSPDGRRAVSGSFDRTLRVWDIEAGEGVRVLEGHTHRVTAAVYSPDGRFILSAGVDGSVRLWDADNGRFERMYHFNNRVEALAVSPDSRLALAAHAKPPPDDYSKTICLFDLQYRRRYRLPFNLTIPVTGGQVLSRESDFQARMAEAEQCISRKNQLGALQAIDAARSIRGYERHAGASKLWADLAAGYPAARLKNAWELAGFPGHDDRITALAVHPAERFVLSGSWDRTLCIWDTQEAGGVITLKGHVGRVTAAVMLEGGGKALSAADDGLMHLWDLKQGKSVKVIPGQSGQITSLDVSADERYGLAGTTENELTLFNLAKGKIITSLQGHQDRITAVAFSPDVRFAAAGCRDNCLYLWDMGTWECRHVMKGHREPVTEVVFSPDGRFVLSSSLDGDLRLWDLEESYHSETYKGHAAGVTTAVIAPNGRYAASGSEDKTIRIWDLKTGHSLRTLEGWGGGITTLAFSPNGQLLASASADNSLRLWRLDWAPVIKEPEMWDEAALPFLEIFLRVHTPYSRRCLARKGRPKWGRADLASLMDELSGRGFGWLKQKGVKKVLQALSNRKKG